MSPRSWCVAALLCSVALAGCTAPTPPGASSGSGSGDDVTVTPNDGLSIAFGTPGSPYQEGEDVLLELLLENTGEAEASDITITTSGISFVAESQCGGNQQPGDGFSLSPVVGSQQGGKQNVIWSCSNSVDLDEGGHDTFPAGIEVTYGYDTDARTTLTAVPADEYGGTSSQAQTQNSAGPVHATMEIASPRPVPEGGTSFTVPVTIENVGDGEIANNGQVGLSTGPNINCDQSTVRVIQGETSIDCSTTTISTSVRQDLTLELELSYTYRESTGTTFRIDGLPGSP